MHQLEGRLKDAVDVREFGDIADAIVLLTEIIADATLAGDYLAVAKALAGRFLCYKHLYQNGGGSENLDQMKLEVAQGFELPISDQDKYVFWLRSGDVAVFENRLTKAEGLYRMAYELVRPGGHEEIECLGHLSELMAINGKPEEAVRYIERGLLFMETYTGTDDWHKDIIISGLHTRMVRVALKGWMFWKAIRSFVAGYKLAWRLKKVHNRPQRLNQYHSVLKFWRKLF